MVKAEHQYSGISKLLATWKSANNDDSHRLQTYRRRRNYDID